MEQGGLVNTQIYLLTMVSLGIFDTNFFIFLMMFIDSKDQMPCQNKQLTDGQTDISIHITYLQ